MCTASSARQVPSTAPRILLSSKEFIAGGLRSGRRRNSRFPASLATRISERGCRRMGNVLVLIPARMASTRLPGKPLAVIAGEPMIAHVLRRAEAAAVGPVVVATDSREVEAAVHKARGRAVMTRSDHASGSDRIFEALGKVDPGGRAEIIVNLQADLPTIGSADIAAALTPLADAAVDIGTLAAEIERAEERHDPNVVKVVGTPVAPLRLRALYFTRTTAP